MPTSVDVTDRLEAPVNVSRERLLEGYEDDVRFICAAIGGEQDADVELTDRGHGLHLPDVHVTVKLHLNDTPLWDEAEGQLVDILECLRKARRKLGV